MPDKDESTYAIGGQEERKANVLDGLVTLANALLLPNDLTQSHAGGPQHTNTVRECLYQSEQERDDLCNDLRLVQCSRKSMQETYRKKCRKHEKTTDQLLNRIDKLEKLLAMVTKDRDAIERTLRTYTKGRVDITKHNSQKDTILCQTNNT